MPLNNKLCYIIFEGADIDDTVFLLWNGSTAIAH